MNLMDIIMLIIIIWSAIFTIINRVCVAIERCTMAKHMHSNIKDELDISDNAPRVTVQDLYPKENND